MRQSWRKIEKQYDNQVVALSHIKRDQKTNAILSAVVEDSTVTTPYDVLLLKSAKSGYYMVNPSADEGDYFQSGVIE